MNDINHICFVVTAIIRPNVICTNRPFNLTIPSVRGLAAITAAAAVWVLVTRRVPTPPLPRITPPPAGILLLSAAIGTAAAAIALGVVAVPAAAGAIGLLAGAVPVAINAERRRRDREHLSEAWPDVVAFMRARITAGATIPEAFIDAAARAPVALQSAGQAIDEAVRYGVEMPSPDVPMTTQERAYTSPIWYTP